MIIDGVYQRDDWVNRKRSFDSDWVKRQQFLEIVGYLKNISIFFSKILQLILHSIVQEIQQRL